MDKGNINMVSVNGELDLNNVFVVDRDTKVKDLMTTNKRILISYEEYRLIVSTINKVSDFTTYGNHDSFGSEGNVFNAVSDIIERRSYDYALIDVSYYVWCSKIFKAMTNGYVVDTTKKFFVRVPDTKDCYYYATDVMDAGHLTGSVEDPYPKDVYSFGFTEQGLKARGFDSDKYKRVEVKYPDDEE